MFSGKMDYGKVFMYALILGLGVAIAQYGFQYVMNGMKPTPVAATAGAAALPYAFDPTCPTCGLTTAEIH